MTTLAQKRLIAQLVLPQLIRREHELRLYLEYFTQDYNTQLKYLRQAIRDAEQTGWTDHRITMISMDSDELHRYEERLAKVGRERQDLQEKIALLQSLF